MGNQIEEKSKLLVKNWVKVDEKTYRNAITEQLINLYTINYHSQEEMQIGQGNLMKRANINHPNVIKLIYFCSNQQKGLCTEKKYSHQVYLQQHGQRLSQLLARPGELKINQCFCCTIVSAFCFLTSKYGFFKADFSMIFLSQQSKWQKTNSKKIVKLWINEKIESNRPQITCKQQEACRSIAQILMQLKKIRSCEHLDKLTHLQTFGKIDKCVEEVYRAHNQQRQTFQRKKIASTYSNTIKNTIKQNQSSFQTLNLRNQRSFSGYIRQQTVPNTSNNTSKQIYRLQTMPSTEMNVRKNQGHPEVKYTESFDRNLQGNFIRNSRRVNFCYNGSPMQQDNRRQIIPEFNVKAIPQVVKQVHQQKSKHVSKKIPKLQSQTINLMLQSYQMIGEKQKIPSFEETDQILRKKLEQITESQPKIASSPFLIEVNQHPDPKQDQFKVSKPFTNLSEFQECQQEKLNISKEQSNNTEIYIGEEQRKTYLIEPNMIPISKSLRQSESSFIINKKQEAPLDNFTRIQLQKSPQFGGINQPPLLPHTSLKKLPERYPSNYSRQSSDSGYENYLQRFNQVINPMSPRSKFSNKSPFQTMPAYKSKNNNTSYTKIPIKQSQSMYFDNSVPKWQPNPPKFMEMSDKVGEKKQYKEKVEIESLYNESEDHSEDNKARIIERIENTQKKIRQNRKKLEKIELEKDLQREKVLIKKQMESLLKNNLISDESNRIKEKVKYKKATFAELKAEAAKILEDLNF